MSRNLKTYIQEVNLTNGRIKNSIGMLRRLAHTMFQSEKETKHTTKAINELEQLQNIYIIRGALCQMRKMLQ